MTVAQSVRRRERSVGDFILQFLTLSVTAVGGSTHTESMFINLI